MSKTTNAVLAMYSKNKELKKEIMDALFEIYEEQPQSYSLREYDTVRGFQDIEWLMLLITGISVTSDIFDISDFIIEKIKMAWSEHYHKIKKVDNVPEQTEKLITVSKSGSIDEIRIKVFPEGTMVDVKASGTGEVILRFNEKGELI